MKNLRICLVLLPLSIVALSLSGCATTKTTHTTAQVSDKTSDPLPPVAEGPGPEPTPNNARSAWGAGGTPSTF